MRHFFAMLAVALLMLAATHECDAQKGYGGGYGWGGYAGAGYGHMHGHGGYGGYGGYYGGPRGYHHAHGFHPSMYNVPYMQPPAFQAGPPSPTVTYPYYTTRGPRDFLMANPPSLGP